MRSHVDWLSITLWKTSSPSDGELYGNVLADAMIEKFGIELSENVFHGTWKIRRNSRAPFSHSWSIEDKGITIFASPTLAYFLIEISGLGCERIIAEGFMDALLKKAVEAVTRIDIACDIKTKTTPYEFVENRTNFRMRTGGTQTSESGDTVYVGSKSSERFARVYRYNKPHPRHELLRVEHELRRDYARICVKNIVELGMGAVVRAAGEAFGWGHSDWQAGEGDFADMSVASASREVGATVYWLVDTVAPCFQRLVREGVIKDAEGFLTRYFRIAE